MLLKNIKFPVFAIGSHKKIWYENNILYLQSNYDIIYKVDNKNLAGDTLGKRRLQINKTNRYKFIGTYFNIAQLIKSNKKLIIDNTGYLFNYIKTKRCKLIYREILSRKPIENKGILLFIKDISSPFLISNYNYNNEKFIGLLNINDGYLIYELTDTRKPDTWRKI